MYQQIVKATLRAIKSLNSRPSYKVVKITGAVTIAPDCNPDQTNKGAEYRVGDDVPEAHVAEMCRQPKRLQITVSE